jgi:hypothetical protein
LLVEEIIGLTLKMKVVCSLFLLLHTVREIDSFKGVVHLSGKSSLFRSKPTLGEERYRQYSTHNSNIMNHIALSSAADDERDMKTLPGMKGYYVRPSRAIEKGGGFFVPGLEGERIRIISAVFLLLLYAINSFGADTDLSIGTITGVIVSLLLLLQGVSTLIPQDIVSPKPRVGTDASSYLSGIQYSPELSQSIVSSLSILSRTMVQTCEKVNYILVVSGFPNLTKKDTVEGAASPTDSNALPEVIFEFGSVSANPSNIKYKETLVVEYSSFSTPNKIKLFSAEEFKQAYANLLGSAAFPASMGGVAVVQDSRGWTWFVASDGDREQLASQELWIESLLYAPIQ